MINPAPPNPKLIELLVTPDTHLPLEYRKERNDMYCSQTGESYKIENSVPILLSSVDEMPGMDYRTHYHQDSELFDYFEKKTGATEHDERRVHEFILSCVPKNTASILDAGCGSAWAAKYCTPKGMFFCSMDISTINPTHALSLYPSSNHAGLAADTFHLPFRDGSFDVVIASEIIEHVVNPSAFVLELLRAIKPGGSLIITTPYKEVLKYSLCVHCNRPTPLHSHLHSFNEQMLAGYGAKKSRVQWKTFGNKALIFLRTYPLLRFFPFPLWKIIDMSANAVLNKRAHILATYTKT